jgi:hypothetical protein
MDDSAACSVADGSESTTPEYYAEQSPAHQKKKARTASMISTPIRNSIAKVLARTAADPYFDRIEDAGWIHCQTKSTWSRGNNYELV